MAFIKIIPLVLLLSCTYSINQISTKGTATDVLDEVQEASPTVSPDISLPMLA